MKLCTPSFHVITDRLSSLDFKVCLLHRKTASKELQNFQYTTKMVPNHIHTTKLQLLMYFCCFKGKSQKSDKELV